MSIHKITKQAQACLPSKEILLKNLSSIDRKTVIYATCALALIGAAAFVGIVAYGAHQISKWGLEDLGNL